jgi:hypothetical protein
MNATVDSCGLVSLGEQHENAGIRSMAGKRLATNLPQVVPDQFREWRISAGLCGPVFVAKTAKTRPLYFRSALLSD